MTAQGSHWVPIVRHWSQVAKHERELGLDDRASDLLAHAYDVLATEDPELKAMALDDLAHLVDGWRFSLENPYDPGE